MSVKPDDQTRCRHPTLRFHSGGYYVECKECMKWWVAIDRAQSSDQAIDHSRGGDGLYAHDERVLPRVAIRGAAHPNVPRKWIDEVIATARDLIECQ